MKINRIVLITAAAALGLTAAWFVWRSWPEDRLPAGLARSNGRLEVERVEIAAKYPGRIVDLPIREGDVVPSGAVLARMDAGDLFAQRAAAMAARQRALSAAARAQAETQVRRVQSRVAQLELDHARNLRREALVSDAEVERREAQRDGERAGVDAGLAAVAEGQAARAEADAQIRRLDLAIGDMVLRAPVTGRIEYRVVQPGSVIPSGGRVATLLDLTEVYLTVFLPTAQAGRLKIGDEARIVLDSVPEAVFPAEVVFVAAQAQFTPKFVETRSEREKLTYRVKLRLPPELARRYAGYVKAGLTANGYVRIQPSAAWPKELAVHLPAS